MEKHNKPPLGLKPIFITQEQRIQEIDEAISRRIRVDAIIPEEWVYERNELLKSAAVERVRRREKGS